MNNLPSWVQEIRPQQRDATEAILDGFARGMNVMIVNGPTGAGKTLIAEMVRMWQGGRVRCAAPSPACIAGPM